LTDTTVRARGRVDFPSLARVLLDNAEGFLAGLIGGGKDGHEWKARKRRDGGLGDSLSVNLNTGAWGHFAAGEEGGDLISLYAYVEGVDQIEAGRALSARFSVPLLLDDGSRAPLSPHGPAGASRGRGESAAREPARPAEVVADKRRSDWTPVVPVPTGAPDATFVHSHRGTPALTWAYRFNGELYGYVCRFTTSDGGKETIPRTWCRNDHDPVNPGAARWHWKGWDEPRPLYLPAGEVHPERMVVVTEGEKCADVVHRLLGDEFTSCTWPGGTKAVKMANWLWLRVGEAKPRVLLCGDTDSQREKIPRDELKAIAAEVAALGLPQPEADRALVERKQAAQLAKPYKPSEEQPGNRAMAELAVMLTVLGHEVWVVPAIGPGVKPDGWDVADAVAGLGVDAPWGADELRAYLRTARRFQPPAEIQNDAAKVEERRQVVAQLVGDNTDPETGGELEIFGWPHYGKEGPKATRENLLHGFKRDPALRGLVGLNEFSQEMWKLKPTPWPSPAGIWREVDDYKLAEYMVLRHNWVQSPSADSIGQALKTVSMDHAFHPVRDRLQALQWDGTARLGEWLFKALGLNPAQMRETRRQYLTSVGQWFIMGMVARVTRPGCKFDYMLVLEGPQGYRKSTLGRVLAGDYFSDTHLDLGNKDSYLQLQGCWVHEFSELHAITGKDVTLVKAFISAQVDYLRAPFDRRPAKYPRQCVFFGTSNNNKWARDRTGNRRMWPVEITEPVRTEWVAEQLDQLLAEALHRVEAGERFHPTHQEEIDWFQPEQAKRVQSTAVEEALYQYLCGERNAKGLDDMGPPKQVTLVQCLESIGIDVAKSASNRNVQSEVIELLHKWGWRHARASKASDGKRPWVYVRPDEWPPKAVTSAEAVDAEDEKFSGAASTAAQARNPAQQAGDFETDDDVPFC